MTTNLTAERMADVPAEAIIPGNNDRKHFDAEELAVLAESIRTTGLLYRPIVRPIDGDRYEIVAGERRYRAMANVLGWALIPVMVRDLDDRSASAGMLVENTGRVDLDLIAEARAYRTRMDEFGLTVGQVAEWAGVSVARVTVRLPLLDLVDEAQHLVARGELSTNHARSMSDLDGNRQHLALAALAKGNLNYFEFADLCQRLRNEQAADGMSFDFQLDEYVVDAQEGRRAKGASKADLLRRAAAALAGVDDDLVAEITAALA